MTATTTTTTTGKSARGARSAPSPMRLVGQEETTAARARPDVRAALESLADLPDDLWFAFERLPDGTLAEGGISVAEVRRELTDGSYPDPAAIAKIPAAAAFLRCALDRFDVQRPPVSGDGRRLKAVDPGNDHGIRRTDS